MQSKDDFAPALLFNGAKVLETWLFRHQAHIIFASFIHVSAGSVNVQRPLMALEFTRWVAKRSAGGHPVDISRFKLEGACINVVSNTSESLINTHRRNKGHQP